MHYKGDKGIAANKGMGDLDEPVDRDVRLDRVGEELEHVAEREHDPIREPLRVVFRAMTLDGLHPATGGH
jgi:hypothetical protein